MEARLQELADQRGAAGVLGAGAHLRRVEGDQLLLALVNSDSPQVLLNKIARLNRSVHSHHRHRVLTMGERLSFCGRGQAHSGVECLAMHGTTKQGRTVAAFPYRGPEPMH